MKILQLQWLQWIGCGCVQGVSCEWWSWWGWWRRCAAIDSVQPGSLPGQKSSRGPKIEHLSRATVYTHAEVGRNVARRETVQDPGQPEASRPAAGRISFRLVFFAFVASAAADLCRPMSCSQPSKIPSASKTQNSRRQHTSQPCCRYWPVKSQPRELLTRTRPHRPSTCSISSPPTCLLQDGLAQGSVAGSQAPF